MCENLILFLELSRLSCTLTGVSASDSYNGDNLLSTKVWFSPEMSIDSPLVVFSAVVVVVTSGSYNLAVPFSKLYKLYMFGEIADEPIWMGRARMLGITLSPELR